MNSDAVEKLAVPLVNSCLMVALNVLDQVSKSLEFPICKYISITFLLSKQRMLFEGETVITLKK